MKAFNSYLEGKLVDLKNSKFEREEFEKIGKYFPISIKQKIEEEFNILTKQRNPMRHFARGLKK